VVALVLRKQFRIYDESGIFMSFSESLDLCLRQSLPLVLGALTCLSVSLAQASSAPPHSSSPGFWGWGGNATESQIDFTKNDLLVGSQDPFFWFMVPLIGLVCVGACVMINYAALAITHFFSVMYSWLSVKPAWLRNEDKRRALSPAFAPSTPRRRILTTATPVLGLNRYTLPIRLSCGMSCPNRHLYTSPSIRQRSPLEHKLQLLQLCPFYPHPHAMDPPNKPSYPRGLGAQLGRSLAYTLLLSPQRPFYHAVYPSGRNFDQW